VEALRADVPERRQVDATPLEGSLDQLRRRRLRVALDLPALRPEFVGAPRDVRLAVKADALAPALRHRKRRPELDRQAVFVARQRRVAVPLPLAAPFLPRSLRRRDQPVEVVVLRQRRINHEHRAPAEFDHLEVEGVPPRVRFRRQRIGRRPAEIGRDIGEQPAVAVDDLASRDDGELAAPRLGDLQPLVQDALERRRGAVGGVDVPLRRPPAELSRQVIAHSGRDHIVEEAARQALARGVQPLLPELDAALVAFLRRVD
jgi:hypothetical protein